MGNDKKAHPGIVAGDAVAKRTNAGPLIPEVGILTLSPAPWSESWQAMNHFLTRISNYVHVLWVNPSYNSREALTQRAPLSGRPAKGSPDFGVYQPPRWLPELHRPAPIAKYFFRTRLEQARRVLQRRGIKHLILYIWRPQQASALDVLNFDLSCYHMDDEYSFSSEETPISDHERRLIERVDHVFIHSPALLEKKGKINPNTTFVPNGVNYLEYATAKREPADLAPIPHPRIGYTGHLKKQLDWRLLLQLAEARPEWSFVFVGPKNNHPEINEPIEKLSRRSNVFFLGAKTVTELTAYPQYFDVCVMPYVRDGYTKYINPIKLQEYLATGKPAVGSRISSLEKFSDIVPLPETKEQWSSALEQALKPEFNRPECQKKRQSIAAAHDWEILSLRIARALIEQLGSKLNQRWLELMPSPSEVQPQL
jgi:glycosyltransferase involved in cell wall biosynthesis